MSESQKCLVHICHQLNMFLFCRHSIVDLCEVKDWKSLYALLRELYSEFSDNVMGSGSIGAGTYFYYQQVGKIVQEEHLQDFRITSNIK